MTITSRTRTAGAAGVTTRRILAAMTAAVLLGLTITACSGGDDKPVNEFVDADAVPVTTGSAGPKVDPDSCNPRASLRPVQALPPAGRMPAGSYMEKILKRGRLILGTSQDTYLFSSRNPATGRIEGFDVDMARQVALAIFGSPDKVDIRVVNYTDRMAKVQADPDSADPRTGNGVDLVADTMTVNCERWAQVSFSSIYYEAGKRVLVAKTSPAKTLADLAGAKVCAASGSTSYEHLAKTAGIGAVQLPTFGDCMVAFQRNEVAGVSADDAILAGMAAQDPYAKVIGPKFSEEPYGMAMSKQHPEFTQFVNAVLERMRADGTWTRTYNTWLGPLGTAPAPPAATYR